VEQPAATAAAVRLGVDRRNKLLAGAGVAENLSFILYTSNRTVSSITLSLK